MDRKLSRFILCLAVTLIMMLGTAIPGLTEQAETGFGEEACTSDAPETSGDGSGVDRSSPTRATGSPLLSNMG